MFTEKSSNYKTLQTVPETLSGMKFDSKDNDLAFNKTKILMETSQLKISLPATRNYWELSLINILNLKAVL